MMTPESLVIDRKFRGVGRIKRATGTTNPAMRRRISRMLTALADDGRLDILRAIRDGKLTMMQVWDAVQSKTLDQLPVGNTVQNLVVAMKAWRETLVEEISKQHMASLKSSISYFEEEDAKATVADIAVVLEKLRAGTLGTKHPRSFNVARSAAMAFIRGTLKKNHPLWLACGAVEPKKVPETKKRRPFTVKELLEAFPDRDTNPNHAIAWSMAMTGMGADEYFGGKWETHADRIHIEGTKRKGRKRDVPLLLVPVVAKKHRRTWEDWFRDHCPNHVAYDLRRTFANLMEDAGIPRTRRKLYMGHGAGDVTGLYEKREVEEFLAVDAGKLRRHIGLPIVAKQRLQRVK